MNMIIVMEKNTASGLAASANYSAFIVGL